MLQIFAPNSPLGRWLAFFLDALLSGKFRLAGQFVPFAQLTVFDHLNNALGNLLRAAFIFQRTEVFHPYSPLIQNHYGNGF